MSDATGRLSLRLLAELVVIFAGVFVALAVDSWWEEREAHVRLASSLEAVARDLDIAREEVDSAILRDSTLTASLKPMLEALGRGESIGLDSIPTGVRLGMRLPIIPYGTLRLVAGSDDSRLLSTVEARSALIQGLSLLQRNDRLNESLAAEARGQWTEQTLVRYETGEVWPNDPTFRAALEGAAGRVDNMVRLLERSRRTIDEMRETVDHELQILRVDSH